MLHFACDVCGQPVFFENAKCVGCEHVLGYLPEFGALSTLQPDQDGKWRSLAPQAQDRSYKTCGNRDQPAACNWMIPAEHDHSLCLACRLNQTIPDLSLLINQERWRRLEFAKRRLIYGLLALKLPISSKQEDPDRGLAFAFLVDPDAGDEDAGRVMTGHLSGLITINAAEADAVVREKARRYVNERYRTVLGHLRHEIGHYYWDLLVRDSSWLDDFRALFGDEREDYGAALQRHHDQGAPADWQTAFVSSYASAHPWEDWAETWAHYMHMTDTAETAFAFGFKSTLQAPAPEGRASAETADPSALEFEQLLDRWLPLTIAINAINRSMGVEDPYPFVLSTPAIDKLLLVHQIIQWPQQR